MARLDQKRSPSKMASSSAGGTQPTSGDVTSQAGASYNNETTAVSKSTSPQRAPTSQNTTQANIHSYNSFKKLIEGHTYHPNTSHSRESSQASTGSDVRRANRDPAHARTSSRESAHARTGSRESACSRGREYKPSREDYSASGNNQLTGDYDEVDNGRYSSPREYSPRRHAHGQPHVNRPSPDYNGESYYGHERANRHSPSEYSQRRQNEDYRDQNRNPPNNIKDIDNKRSHNRDNKGSRHTISQHSDLYHAPPDYKHPPKYQPTSFPGEARLADPYPAHRRNDLGGQGMGRPGGDAPQHRRSTPEGKDTSQHFEGDMSGQDVHYNTPPTGQLRAESPDRARPKLQRQIGVHIKDDMAAVHAPQPVSGFTHDNRPVSTWFMDQSVNAPRPASQFTEQSVHAPRPVSEFMNQSVGFPRLESEFKDQSVHTQRPVSEFLNQPMHAPYPVSEFQNQSDHAPRQKSEFTEQTVNAAHPEFTNQSFHTPHPESQFKNQSVHAPHPVSEFTSQPMHAPRPKSEFMDRSHMHQEPVVYRGGNRRPRTGYVNSAYIEDGHGSADQETVPQDPTGTDGSNPHPTASHRVSEKAHSDANSRSEKADALSGVRDHTGLAPLKHPLKKTVNEAIKEREDQVKLRRQYVLKKHRPANNNHLPYNEVDIHIPRTKENSTKKTTSNPVSLQQPNPRWSRALDRPLSPHKKTQRRFTFNQSVLKNMPPEPPEVGLQKFVRTDSKTKGGAVMVHKAPSTGKTRNPSGGPNSPIIINVGEMTWNRLKRQVSKKNVYVVQQEDEEKEAPAGVGRPPKPRTHFTLSLFTLCFCLSPLGFIAMVFAVCSASAYKDRDHDLGSRLSRVALVLSILGILGTIATTAILIGTNTIPVMGRYGEPPGN